MLPSGNDSKSENRVTVSKCYSVVRTFTTFSSTCYFDHEAALNDTRFPYFDKIQPLDPAVESRPYLRRNGTQEMFR